MLCFVTYRIMGPQCKTSGMAFLILAFWILTVTAGYVMENAERVDDPIVAYDCESKNIKIASISMVDVPQCVGTYAAIAKEEKMFAQILRKRNPSTVHVFRCQILKKVFSMDRRSNANRRPEISRPHEVSALDCQQLHDTLTINIDGKNIKSLANATTYFTTNITGWQNSKGYHGSGVTNIYDGISYLPSTVLIVEYRVKLSDTWIAVPADDTSISHPAGVKCPLTGGSCLDPEIGTLTWKRPFLSFDEDKFDVLYAGNVSMVHTTAGNSLIRVVSSEFLLHAYLTPLFPLNETKFYSTKYAGLFVSTCTSAADVMFKKSPVLIFSAYVMARYIDAEIEGLELYMGQTLTVAYNRYMYVFCLAVIENLEHMLTIVYNSPLLAHLIFDSKRGVLAAAAGEGLYLTSCEPVTVELRSQDTCSQELPVLYLGQKKFMTPITRILTSSSNPVPCSRFTPVVFRIRNEWVQMTPQYSHAKKPAILSPLKLLRKVTIFHDSDIQEIGSYLMAPIDKKNILNNFATGISGGQTSYKYDVTQAFNSQAWKNVVEHLNAVWGLCCGLLGICFALIVVMAIINIIVRTYSIYKITGLSWPLLSGLCSSATTWLMMTWFNSPKQKSSIELSNEEFTEMMSDLQVAVLPDDKP